MENQTIKEVNGWERVVAGKHRDTLCSNCGFHIQSVFQVGAMRGDEQLCEECACEIFEEETKEEILGCGKFDKENPQLIRCCGDILFSNKVWLCEDCRKKSYTAKQKEIIDRGDEL